MTTTLSIYDIARAAGTSPRTVSRFFNHPDKLAPATRERIALLVDRSGFRPSEVASRLSNQSAGAIAVMLWVEQGPPGELHQQLLGLVSAELSHHGRDLLLIGLTSRNLPAVIAQHLARRKLESVLLLTPVPVNVQQAIHEAGVATISLNWHPGRALPNNHYIGIDYYVSMREFAVKLLKHGARRLVWIASSDVQHDRRSQALHDVAEAMGVDIRVVEPASDSSSWDACLEVILHDGEPLAACWRDSDAVALLAAAQRRGVQVPGRLAITGFDGIAAGALIQPILTTVMQPWEAMAARATSLLIAPSTTWEDAVIPATIRWGGTCPQPEV